MSLHRIRGTVDHYVIVLSKAAAWPLTEVNKIFLVSNRWPAERVQKMQQQGRQCFFPTQIFWIEHYKGPHQNVIAGVQTV